MTSSVVESLQGLRDVQGVLGSFVLGRSGRVLCKDLPRLFDDRVFEEVGPRILRLKETLSGDGPGLDNVVIRYSEHKLHLRFLSANVLGVITSIGVNAASLKMALTLSSRRIETDLGPEPLGLSSGDRHSAVPAVGTAAPPPLWVDESARSVASRAPQEALPVPPTLRSPKPSAQQSPQPSQPPPTSPQDGPKRAPILYRGRRIG
jgi:hypothetical protein